MGLFFQHTNSAFGHQFDLCNVRYKNHHSVAKRQWKLASHTVAGINAFEPRPERTQESTHLSIVPPGQSSTILPHQPPRGWLISPRRSATNKSILALLQSLKHNTFQPIRACAPGDTPPKFRLWTGDYGLGTPPSPIRPWIYQNPKPKNPDLETLEKARNHTESNQIKEGGIRFVLSCFPYSNSELHVVLSRHETSHQSSQIYQACGHGWGRARIGFISYSVCTGTIPCSIRECRRGQRLVARRRDWHERARDGAYSVFEFAECFGGGDL